MLLGFDDRRSLKHLALSEQILVNVGQGLMKMPAESRESAALLARSPLPIHLATHSYLIFSRKTSAKAFASFLSLGQPLD